MSAPSDLTWLQELRRKPTTLVYDLEGNDFYEGCTEIHCAAWKWGDSDEIHSTRDIKEFFRQLRKAETVVGHNILRYDNPVLVKLFAGLFPGVKSLNEKSIDTIILSRMAYADLGIRDNIENKMDKDLYGKHKLEAWGRRMGVLKTDYQGGFESWNQEMQDYCEQDVMVTDTLFERLAQCELPEAPVLLEMKVGKWIAAMERNGVQFDVKEAQKLYARLAEKANTRLEELQVVFPPIEPVCTGVYGNQKKRALRDLAAFGTTEHEEMSEDEWLIKHREKLEPLGIKFKWTKRVEFNPNSNQHIEARMREKGWIPTQFTDTGLAKVDEPVLIKMAKTFPVAEPLMDYLLINKRMSQLISKPKKGDEPNGLIDRATDAGRIHGFFNTLGCISHRFSHSFPNLGQVPACDKPYGKEFRSLFGARPGFKFVGFDADGLELRMLATYLEPWDKGRYAKAVHEGKKEDGTDIHSVNTAAAGLASRAQGKRFIYALMYGAGDAKLGEIALPGVNNRMQLIKAGKRLRAKFMRALPAMKFLTDGVKKKAAKQKKLKGLDGRILSVRSAHSALNLLLQSAGAILVKLATVLFCEAMEAAGYIHGRDWFLCLHIHDEWQYECRQEDAHETTQIAASSLEQAGRELGVCIPTTGTAQVGNTWAETH